jgi:hypothetical protein
MTAVELVGVDLLTDAFRRAHRAAEVVNLEHPNLEVLVYLDKQITTVEPDELPNVHFLVIAGDPGVSRGGNLEPAETVTTMTATIRAAAQYVTSEVARMEATHPYECEEAPTR